MQKSDTKNHSSHTDKHTEPQLKHRQPHQEPQFTTQTDIHRTTTHNTRGNKHSSQHRWAHNEQLTTQVNINKTHKRCKGRLERFMCICHFMFLQVCFSVFCISSFYGLVFDIKLSIITVWIFCFSVLFPPCYSVLEISANMPSSSEILRVPMSSAKEPPNALRSTVFISSLFFNSWNFCLLPYLAGLLLHAAYFLH